MLHFSGLCAPKAEEIEAPKVEAKVEAPKVDAPEKPKKIPRKEESLLKAVLINNAYKEFPRGLEDPNYSLLRHLKIVHRLR